MPDRSVDELVDLAERQHLSPEVEAEFVDQAYAAAFSSSKHGEKSDEEVLRLLAAASQGSVRVLLLARQRTRATWDANPTDANAASAHRLLTLAAAALLPSDLDDRSYV